MSAALSTMIDKRAVSGRTNPRRETEAVITHFRVTVAGGSNPALMLFQQFVGENGITIGNQNLAILDYDAAVELRRELDAAIAQVDKAHQVP